MDAKAQVLAPDLEAIRRFIVQMIARGAIAEMIAKLVGRSADAARFARFSG